MTSSRQDRVGMVLHDWLLARLCCPRDHARLGIGSSSLICTGCGAEFPIDHGIPVFISEERRSYQEREEYPVVDEHNPTICSLTAGLDKEFDLIADLLPGAVALDVGSGGCFPASYLAARFEARLVALDPCVTVLDRYGQKFIDYFGTPPGSIGRVAGDAYTLPFADSSFEAVVGAGYLHHFEDLDRALEELRRVLVPGGVLFATSERLDPHLRESRGTSLEDQLHTRGQWRRYFARSGFRVVHEHVMVPTINRLRRILPFRYAVGTPTGVFAGVLNSWLLGHSVTFILQRPT